MSKTPPFPKGVKVYQDTNGTGSIWRVSFGVSFLGRGSKPFKRAFSAHREAVEFVRKELASRQAVDPKEVEATGLTESQLLDAKYAMHKLDGKASLTDAAEAWLRLVAPFKEAPSVEGAIDLLLRTKKSVKLSERHIRELKAKLHRMFRSLLKKNISEINRSDLESIRDALDSTGNEPSSSQRRKRIRYIGILVNFAIERNWIDVTRSPLRGLEKPAQVTKPVKVLTPHEVAKLLMVADAQFPEILEALAIKIFSGVRNSELYKLQWEWIKNNSFQIPAAFAKTKRSRSVSIHPTLTAWLKDVPNKRGLVLSAKPSVKDREAVWLEYIKKLRDATEVANWQQNALRHCFGSYHYQLKKNSAATAFEMGNSPRVVQTHYVNAVTEEDCEVFWKMVPWKAEEWSEGVPNRPNYSVSTEDREDDDYWPPDEP